MSRLSERAPLFAGGVAAIAASACCLGPLVFVSIGLGGAWLANLRVLEPYRPVLIGAGALALFFAYRRIFRRVEACRPGDVCSVPRVNAAYRVFFWLVAALLVIAIVFPFVAPLFY